MPVYDIRAMERSIRQSKRELAGYDEAIKHAGDENLKKDFQINFDRTSVKLKQQEAKYKEFSYAVNQRPDNIRTQVHGFNRSVSQKAVWANKKAVANSQESGIIEKSNELYRNKNYTHRKLSASGNSVITYPEYKKITSKAIKNGANIIRGDPYHEERLLKMNKSASTLGDTIFLRTDCTISDVLEETYHFEQNRQNINSDKNHELRMLLNEIDAQEYLLSNSDKYNIPLDEIEVTKSNLKDYKNRLAQYYEQEGK